MPRHRPTSKNVPHREGAGGPTQFVLALSSLAGFAIAQPLFHLMGRYPEFLIAHRVSAADLLLLAIGLGLVLPIALALPALIVGQISRRSARPVRRFSIALVATLGWAQIVGQAGFDSGFLAVAVALGLAGATTWIYVRYPAFRRGLAFISVVALAFPALFLLRDPIRGLLTQTAETVHSSIPRDVDTPVVLLVLDEFPLVSLLDEHERLDAERFPNISRLAGEGVWYRNATTVAESTSYAVPAILSGRYPYADVLLPHAKHYPTNLFTVVGETYDVHAIETVTRLCPRRICTRSPDQATSSARRTALFADVAAIFLNLVVPETLETGLPTLGDRWRDFWETPSRATPQEQGALSPRDGQRAMRHLRAHPREAFDQFVSDIEHFPSRTVHYLHVLLPHAPWRYLPDGQSYPPRPDPGATRDSATRDFSWSDDPWQVAQGLQRHLLQVGFADQLVGQLRARLEELDLYDRALVIVTADHGAAFRPGSSTRHLGAGGETLPEIANVLLTIKYPGGKTRGIDDSNVETIDILPTILNTLQSDIDRENLDGIDLQDDKRRKRKRLYPSWSPGSARGTPRHFDVQDLARRREALLFNHQLFGTGSWSKVFAGGSHEALIGKRRSEFEHLGDVAIRLDDPESLETVNVDSGELPLLLSGTISRNSLPTNSRSPLWIALLVNDRVAAATRVVRHQGEQTFFAVAAPTFFNNGPNRVRAVALPAKAISSDPFLGLPQATTGPHPNAVPVASTTAPSHQQRPRRCR